MFLIVAALLVDTVRLYYRAEATDAGLEKRFGNEYKYWKLVNIDGMNQTLAMQSLNIKNVTWGAAVNYTVDSTIFAAH